MHRNVESKSTIASSFHDLQVFTPDPDMIKEKKHSEELYSSFSLDLSKDVHETHAGP